MLRIRLRRTGKKKQPQYRVVVADQRAPRDGAFVEILGHYNPRTTPRTLVLKEERVRYWLSQGAQPSETVHRLLFSEGLIEAEPRKRVTKPSKAEREAAAAAASTEATTEAPADAASDESTDDASADTPAEASDDAKASDDTEPDMPPDEETPAAEDKDSADETQSE